MGEERDIYYRAEIHPRSVVGSIHNRKCDSHPLSGKKKQGGNGLFNDLQPYALVLATGHRGAAR